MAAGRPVGRQAIGGSWLCKLGITTSSGCRALYDKLRDGYQLCNCCEKNAKLHQAGGRREATGGPTHVNDDNVGSAQVPRTKSVPLQIATMMSMIDDEKE